LFSQPSHVRSGRGAVPRTMARVRLAVFNTVGLGFLLGGILAYLLSFGKD